MTNKNISGLTAATTPLTGTELVPIWDGTGSKKVSVDNLTNGKPISATQVTASTGNFIPATSGKGVDFSAHSAAAGMTSKVLVNYEEGTWTPTDASGASLTFAFANGKYTRVGRQVTINGEIGYPTTASTAGAAIAGLPFNASGNYSGCFGFSGGRPLQLFINNATDNFAIYRSDINSAATNAFVSGASLYFTATYFV